MCGPVVSRLLVFLALVLVACDNDAKKPYTPFGVATSAGPSAPPGAESKSSAAPPTAEAISLSVRPPASHADVGEKTLRAPAGRLLSEVLVIPATPTVYAYARLLSAGPLSGADLGELWQLLPTARKLGDAPAFIPTAPGCKPSASLEQSGKDSFVFELKTACANLTLPARSPTRALQIFSPLESPRLALALRASDPSTAGKRLQLVANSPDLDGDGSDDITVEVRLAREGAPFASARWAWLGRAAGPTRADDEPKSSFARQASHHSPLGPKASDYAKVSGELNDVRSLFAYMCDESGTPHVFDASGRGLGCGDMTIAARRLLETSVRAALRASRADAALVELERADWFPLTTPDALKPVAQALRGEVFGALATSTPGEEVLTLRPLTPGPTPQFSTLAFQPDGALLVLTGDGVFEWRQGRVRDVSEEVDPWPLIPAGPTFEQLAPIEFPCEQETLSVQARHVDGALREVLPTPWHSPRPGVCRGGAAFFQPTLTPLHFGRSGTEVQLGPLRLPDHAAAGAGPPGSPLSPDGKVRAAATPWGVLIVDGTEPKFWKTSGAPLGHCVVRNDAQQVACLRNGQAVLLRPAADRH